MKYAVKLREKYETDNQILALYNIKKKEHPEFYRCISFHQTANIDKTFKLVMFW